jgi:hypothetical protein
MRRIQLVALTIGMVVATGCATNGDVRIAKEEAITAATEADRKADEALREAREAKRIAQNAEGRADRSEEMLNRGFKRSMYK